jgi:hypothetical protein
LKISCSYAGTRVGGLDEHGVDSVLLQPAAGGVFKLLIMKKTWKVK